MSTPILETKNLTMRFGGLVAVNSFNMSMGETELVGVIGPNGAGKTTVFNMITGIYEPSEGDVLLSGQSIVGRHVAHITQQGIARTFQNIRLFKDLTVLDNIRVAGHARMGYGLMANIFRTKKFHQEEARLKEEALKLLRIFKLEDKQEQLAKNLPTESKEDWK